jgi:hypothetical protein
MLSTVKTHQQQAHELMSDVDSEFASLASVWKRFLSWRSLYPKQYQSAFIGDFLPRLLSPLVRLELLQWFPLADPSLNAMQFIPTLFDENPNAALGDSLLIPQVCLVFVCDCSGSAMIMRRPHARLWCSLFLRLLFRACYTHLPMRFCL